MKSAIVGSNTEFVSKRGAAGLYRHSPKEAPYNWSVQSCYGKGKAEYFYRMDSWRSSSFFV